MAATMPRLELVLPAVPSSIRRARGAVGDAVAELTEGGRLADDVRLCVSEAVTNVVRHAYAGRRRGDVEVVVEAGDDELGVVVRDRGGGMSTTRSRGKGGFGLKIIDKLARGSSITSKRGAGTEVRMTFPLDGEATSRD
jgi:serine/threonine-protein kinase RsbW